MEAHINKYKVELSIYNDLKTINKNLYDQKTELKNNKASYHSSGVDMEKKMKELLSDKTLNLNDLPVPVKNQLNYLAKNPKKLLKKYKDSIKNVNDL